MFEPGVRVRLMSGGPVMTVMQRESDGHYRCTWFKDDKPNEYYFPEAVLEAVEPDENRPVRDEPRPT